MSGSRRGSSAALTARNPRQIAVADYDTSLPKLWGHGGELTRIAVEVAAPLGSYTGWEPARTVTQWAFTVGA